MTKNIASAARPAPPVGGFQEVDGRRIFVHRMGSGGPAVVFLPGASLVGLDYFVVQQKVSQFSTAVVYDRGGTGYSDPVALPRTAAAVATELYEVLRAQDVATPYVLVVHSLGGAYAHRFAQMYPQEVAGLVCVDGFYRDWDEFMPAAVSLGAVERMMAPTPEQLRPAVREMFTELVVDYPQHMRESLIEAHISDEWLRAGIAERSNMVALADELRCGTDIPDVPMVALTAEGADPGQQAMPEETMRAIHEGARRLTGAMVGRVSYGEHRVVADAGHNQLCFTHTEVVVRAIRDVLDRARA